MTFKTAVAMLALFAAFQVQAATLTGRVVNVSDGDTITVLDADKVQHKIRLTGIDAPERKQAFGNVSRESLADMVAEQQVTVEFDKQDRYDRVLGKVLVDGRDVNLMHRARHGLVLSAVPARAVAQGSTAVRCS